MSGRPPSLGGGARLWVGGPVPPGYAAITIGRLVIVRRDAAGDERLLRHELVHVEQWRRYGAVGFLRRYLGAYLRARWQGHTHREAYRRIPLEVEAEKRSGLAGLSGLSDPPTPG